MAETGTKEMINTLGSVSRGAILFIFGRGASKVIGLVTNVILTRRLGADSYGTYAYFLLLSSLFRVVTRFGSDQSVQRYIPEYRNDSRRRQVMLSLAYGTSLLFSIIVTVLIYVAAPVISEYTLSDQIFVNVLRIGAIVITFNTLSNITSAAFKSIERMEYVVGVSYLAQPIFKLVFVGGAVLAGFSLIGATAGLVVSGILTFLLAVYVLRTRTNLYQLVLPDTETAREYYDFSVPLVLNQTGNFLYNRIDILMIGILLSGSAVGVYNIAALLSGVLILPLSAFNQLFPPVVSRLYHDGKLDQLSKVYATVTRWTFTITLFPAMAGILYSVEVLKIFGEGFVVGRTVLILFILSQLTNSAVGPSGILLMMTDNQYLTLANQLTFGILNVILNYILILEFGLIGAAAATAVVKAGINILRVLEVWYLEGFLPYDVKYFKPIIAGTISLIPLYAAFALSTGLTRLIGGSLLSGGIFIATLYVAGIEDEEAELAKNMIDEIY